MRKPVVVVVVQQQPRLQHRPNARLLYGALHHGGGGGRCNVAFDGIQNDIAQGEVHHRIHSREPFFGKVGNFPHHQRTGFGLVRGLGEFGKVLGSQLRCHVQAPTIHPFAQPRLNHRVRLGIDEIPHRRVFQLEFGQVGGLNPAPCAAGVLVAEEEPVAVHTVAVCQCLLEGLRIAPHVVKNTVEHHLHAHGVAGIGKACHVVFGAKFWRNFQVIQCIVLVVGDGMVNGVEVEHINTQFLQIAQFALHAGQITTPKIEFVAPDIGRFQVLAPLGRFTPAVQNLGWRVEAALGFQMGRGHKPIY